MDRILSKVARIDSGKLTNKSLAPREREIINNAAARLRQHHNMMLDADSNLTIDGLEAKLMQYKPDIAFIDHIGLLSPTDPRQTEYQRVSEITRRLKVAAMKMGIVVVELCQINRAGVKGNEGRFCNLEDLRGSGTIEQDANSAIFVENRRTEDSKELRGEDAYQDTAVMYAKNREGSTGVVSMRWQPQYHQWQPAPKEDFEEIDQMNWPPRRDRRITMISIAIINLKGGVGKSVTACNLAAELAAKSKSVLVVDLDKQGNTSKFFGVADYDRPCVSSVLLGMAMVRDAIVETAIPAVALLPCDMRMLKANREMIQDTGPRQFYLRNRLEPVEGKYDYCLMDCPPDLDMGSINALTAADWVIIPVDCDEWACDGMREIIDQIEQVQMYYNPHLKVMGALMTKYRRTRYAGEVVHQLNEAGIEMLHTVIRYTVKVSEAKSAHEPLRVYKPDCSAALDYGCLADEVDEAVSKMDTHKEG